MLILIVEDEGLIAFEMMEFLTRKGYRVAEPVATGEQAIERCGKTPKPDLLLMDIHLAGKIDGIEAAHRIREQYKIPVIMLTACDDGMTGIRLKELAPEGYLVKPSTGESLLNLIMLVFQAELRKNSRGESERFSGSVEHPGQ